MNFQLWPVIFFISLWVQGYTVPHWKALRCGKDDSRELSCGSTLNIHQDVLKSGNILYRRGFVDYQSSSIVMNINKIARDLPCLAMLAFYSTLTISDQISYLFYSLLTLVHRWCVQILACCGFPRENETVMAFFSEKMVSKNFSCLEPFPFKSMTTPLLT